MSPTSQSRRRRVESGIYVRLDASGADVLKRGKPVYEIGFRDAQGKQRWRVVEGGITAAKSALAQAHSDRARGVRTAVDPRLRFGDAADRWWEARVVKQRPATQSAYAASLKHLRERFGRVRLTDITPDDVAKFVSAQQAAGLKGWTIRGHLVVLSGIFRYAGRHLGFSGANPVAMLDRVERPSTEDERPKRVLDGDEVRRLLEAVDAPYRLLYEFAAETGARLSEVLAIVWGEVDLDEGAVTLTHQLGRDRRRVPLKTKRSRRTLEITPDLAAKLREARIHAARSGDHDFVFVAPRTGTPHDHRNIGGRVLARAVKRAGLEAVERDGEVVEPAPTFHNLRHSHGSALIAAGWDIAEVSARLGHANVATTLRVYVHEYEASRRSADRRNRLAALYGSAEAPRMGDVVELDSARSGSGER